MKFLTRPQYEELFAAADSPFLHDGLRAAHLAHTLNGPEVREGESSAVYRFRGGHDEPIAVRVYTHSPIEGDARKWLSQRARFTRQFAEAFNCRNPLPAADYLLGYFEFVPDGIRTSNGATLPLVSMEWRDGEPLDQWLRRICEDGDAGMLESAAEQWASLLYSLSECELVHGQLTPRHIIVANGGFRLIDYDVSQFLYTAREEEPVFPRASSALQHPDFRQVPQASAGREGSFCKLDVYPGWYILTMLRVLSLDPTLITRSEPSGGLFSDSAVESGRNAEVFQRLEKKGDATFVYLWDHLCELYNDPVANLPSGADLRAALDARPRAARESKSSIPEMDQGAAGAAGGWRGQATADDRSSKSAPAAAEGDALPPDAPDVGDGGGTDEQLNAIRLALKDPQDAEAQRRARMLFDVRVIRQRHVADPYDEQEQQEVLEWVTACLAGDDRFAELREAYPNCGVLRVEPLVFELDWQWPPPRCADHCVVQVLQSDAISWDEPRTDGELHRMRVEFANRMLIQLRPDEAEARKWHGMRIAVWPEVDLGFATVYGKPLVLRETLDTSTPRKASRRRKKEVR